MPAAGQCGAQPGKAGRRARPANRRLQPPGGVAKGFGRHPAGGERMLQRGEQRHRRQRVVGKIEHEAQKGAGRRAVERHAGRVVDVDRPAPQFGGDAAGQLAVRGDQRRGRAGGVERPAQQHRDRHRLVLRIDAVVAGQPG